MNLAVFTPGMFLNVFAGFMARRRQKRRPAEALWFRWFGRCKGDSTGPLSRPLYRSLNASSVCFPALSLRPDPKMTFSSEGHL